MCDWGSVVGSQRHVGGAHGGVSVVVRLRHSRGWGVVWWAGRGRQGWGCVVSGWRHVGGSARWSLSWKEESRRRPAGGGRGLAVWWAPRSPSWGGSSGTHTQPGRRSSTRSRARAAEGLSSAGLPGPPDLPEPSHQSAVVAGGCWTRPGACAQGLSPSGRARPSAPSTVQRRSPVRGGLPCRLSSVRRFPPCVSQATQCDVGTRLHTDAHHACPLTLCPVVSSVVCFCGRAGGVLSSELVLTLSPFQPDHLHNRRFPACPVWTPTSSPAPCEAHRGLSLRCGCVRAVRLLPRAERSGASGDLAE